MPNFENGPWNNTEVETVEVEGEYCTVGIAGFKLIFIGTERDGEVHLTHAWNPDGLAVGMQDIPPVIYQNAQSAAEKAFNLPEEPERPFEVTKDTLQDARLSEFVHEHGEEETERVQREQNRPATGAYASEKKPEQNQESEEDETGKQGELNFPKDQ